MKFINSLSIMELTILISITLSICFLAIKMIINYRNHKKHKIEHEKVLNKKHTEDDYYHQSQLRNQTKHYFCHKKWLSRKKLLKKKRLSRKTTINYNK